MMNKVKVLWSAIVLLFTLNLAVLYLFVTKNQENHKPKDTHYQTRDHELRRIQKAFNFSDQQMQEFKRLKDEHTTRIKPLMRNLKKASEKYYLDFDSTSTLRDSLLQTINKLNEEIYNQNSKHFRDVEKLCSPEQKHAMEGFIQNLTNRRHPGKKPHD